MNAYLYRIRLIIFLRLFLMGSLLMILSMELSYFTPATHQDNVELLSPPSTAHSSASSYLVVMKYGIFTIWHTREYINKQICRSILKSINHNIPNLPYLKWTQRFFVSNILTIEIMNSWYYRENKNQIYQWHSIYITIMKFCF